MRVSRRGSALVVVLLLSALLAAVAGSSALLADLQLRLVRQRADALAAEGALLAGAAVAEALVRAHMAATGALPAALALPPHPDLSYRLQSYRMERGVARVGLAGEGPTGGWVAGTLELIVSAGNVSVRLHR